MELFRYIQDKRCVMFLILNHNSFRIGHLGTIETGNPGVGARSALVMERISAQWLYIFVDQSSADQFSAIRCHCFCLYLGEGAWTECGCHCAGSHRILCVSLFGRRVPSGLYSRIRFKKYCKFMRFVHRNWISNALPA